MQNKHKKKSIEAEGKTTQEAIKTALSLLGTTREKVVVKVLCEGEAGLYGMSGGKSTKVRVTMKE